MSHAKSNSRLAATITLLAVAASSAVAYWWTHSRATTPPPHPQPAQATPAPPSPAAAPALLKAEDDFHTLTVTLAGPLETTLVRAVGRKLGAPLTQVVTRLLVWWLRVPTELMKGDVLAIVYETPSPPHAEPRIHAVRLLSRKLGRTRSAYRYHPQGAQFPSFFQPDGSALEKRLVDGPIDAYLQITSMLSDGRRHRGIDFKTPVGTPVRAPFDGIVTRTNWKLRYNGNSIEVKESGGQRRTAIFLHLSPLPSAMRPGRVVRKGAIIAHSGNSGRSFAPHLHYQLMRGGKVINPFSSHKSHRRVLSKQDEAPFSKAMQSLDKRLEDSSAFHTSFPRAKKSFP